MPQVLHLPLFRETQLLRSLWFLVPELRVEWLRCGSHVGRGHEGLQYFTNYSPNDCRANYHRGNCPDDV